MVNFTAAQQRAFTLIEILVVMILIGICARVVVPVISSSVFIVSPEQEWMQALAAAELEARKTDTWIELAVEPAVSWKRWSWDPTKKTWNGMEWLPPQALSEAALKVRAHTMFSQGHVWVPPQRIIPFFQGVCLSEQSCIFRMPTGELYVGAVSDVVNSQ